MVKIARKKKHSKKDSGFSLKSTTALIIIIFLIGFGSTMWYYALHKVAYVHVFEMQVELVSESRLAGFNADPNLNFGQLPAAGGRAKKEMNLRNEYDIPLLVEIRIKGDIAELVYIDENYFTLQPGEVKHIWMTLSVPKDSSYAPGNYTGTAKVLYKRQ